MAESPTFSIQDLITLDDLDTLVLVADTTGAIVYSNNTVTRLFGFEPKEILGNRWFELISESEEEAISRRNNILKIAKGKTNVEYMNLHESKMTINGQEIWTQWTNSISKSGYIVGVATDITVKKHLEKLLQDKNAENELLLKEIHHRVKNNLQIISSFLNLQFSNISDYKAIRALETSKDRLHSMALVHTMLYESGSLDIIHFDQYLNNLLDYVDRSYNMNKEIELIQDSDPCVFGIDLAINLGLIITELVTNSFKHAFTSGDKGSINVALSFEKNQSFKLLVSDTGTGYDSNLARRDNSLGLEIVDSLVEQISGKMAVSTTEGTKIEIQFSV
jgi:PAS domain S-box-containing protein